MSLLNTLATFLAGRRFGATTTKKRIGDHILGIGPYGIGQPDKPSNPALHRHAVEAIYRVFGDDWFWGILVATSVYMQNCRTTEDIDRIVSEHSDSRADVFPGHLYRDQGWNPGRALWFLGDQAEYRRVYHSPLGDKWSSSEYCLDDSDRFRSSGYELSGRRACVRTIVLNQGADERQKAAVAALANGFAIAASKLIREACGIEMPDSMRDAIHGRAKYDGAIGSADVTFAFTGANRQDWTNPPTVNFTLRVEWGPPGLGHRIKQRLVDGPTTGGPGVRRRIQPVFSYFLNA